MQYLGELTPKMMIGYHTSKSIVVAQEEAAEFALENDLLF